MTGLPAASYADALYRDPRIAMRLAVARRGVLESEIYAQAAIAEKAAADVRKAVVGGEQKNYSLLDDMATELARASLRLRKRSRELARREPVRRPRPPVVCPQCDYTIDRGLSGSQPSAISDRQEDPKCATGSLPASAEAESRDDETLADEPPVAHLKQKGESGSDGHAQEGRGGLGETNGLSDAGDDGGESHRPSCRSASLRDPDNASLLSGPPSVKEVAPDRDGQGSPRPYISDRNAETENPQPETRNLQPAALPRKERRRLAAIERKRRKKEILAKRRKERELVEVDSPGNRTLADQPPVAHLEQKIESSADGRGGPRPYISEPDAETDDPGPRTADRGPSTDPGPSPNPQLETRHPQPSEASRRTGELELALATMWGQFHSLIGELPPALARRFEQRIPKWLTDEIEPAENPEMEEAPVPGGT